MRIDIDIMTENGTHFYGRIRKEVKCDWMIINDEVREYITDEQLHEVIFDRFPTLRNKPFRICPNNM